MFRVFRVGLRFLSSNVRETGSVKRFSREKGFGFIKRDSDGQDLFVHYQSIVGKGFQTLQVIYTNEPFKSIVFENHVFRKDNK